MARFLPWCIRLRLCWPLALLALLIDPIVWVLLLPFRPMGVAVGGVFALLVAIIMFPARVLSGRRAVRETREQLMSQPDRVPSGSGRCSRF